MDKQQTEQNFIDLVLQLGKVITLPKNPWTDGYNFVISGDDLQMKSFFETYQKLKFYKLQDKENG